jgi:transmembrane sensor
MTHDNRIWVLMSRYLSGETSAEEGDELQDLLEQSPRRQYLFDILHSYFIDPPAAAAGSRPDDPDLDDRFHKILISSKFRPVPGRATGPLVTPTPRSTPPPRSTPTPRNTPHPRRLLYLTPGKWLAATAIAACLILGWAVYRLATPAAIPLPARNVRSEEILARAGTRTKLLLPDGTQVWLNSNSRLKYTGDFNSKNREVALEGEAYFEVVKDIRLPFIVQTAGIDIKVLGTSFVVKSYPQDETIETTLLKGAIEVSRKDVPGSPRVILKPNEKLVFSKHFAALNHTGASPVTSGAHSSPVPDMAVGSIRQDIPDSDKVETAWLYNRLVFDGDNFKELTDKMERWYNVRITIRDTILNSYHFGGIFENETLDQAFKELQLTREFIYKRKGNDIELYAKE